MKGQKPEAAAAPNRLEGIRTQRRKSPASPEGSGPGRRIAFAHFVPGAFEVEAHPHPYSPEELGKLPRNIAEQLPDLALALQEDVRAALTANGNKLANKLGGAFAPKHGAGKSAVVIRVDWFQTGARIKYVRNLEAQLTAVLDKLAQNADGKGVYAGDLNGDKRFGFTVWADAAPAAKGPLEVKGTPEKLEKREELSHNRPVSRSPQPPTPDAPESAASKKARALLGRLFADLHGEIGGQPVQTARVLAGDFRRGLIGYLEPAFRELLQTNPPGGYAGRLALVKELNSLLRELGLAVRHPITKRPCSLMGDPYRIRLQSKDRTSPSSSSTTSLPPLELMEAPRQEKLSSRSRGADS